MMSHGVILGLLDLPVEILLEILAYLDVYELVRTRGICNALLRAIDSSEELLYAIDLKYFQMIPSPLPGSVLPVATRRQLLRQSETAWQKGEYSQSCHIPYPCANHQLSCGVFGYPAFLKAINFIQLPLYANEHTDTTSWRQWCYQTDREIVNHCFSPAQDLLVLLTRAPPGESHEYEISFRSLSEDKVHPDAASAIVTVPAAQARITLEFLESRGEGKIFGDYYGLLSNDARSHGVVFHVMQVWNWKVKDCYQYILIESDDSDNNMDFCLISNDRLLLVDEYGKLMLYSLVNFPNAIQLTAKFSLPVLTGSSSIAQAHFTGTQDYSSSTLPLRSSWFQASAHSQLIAISLSVHLYLGTENCHVTFYVEQNSFLELESTYTNRYGKPSQYYDSRALPWSSWGPKYTWSFLGRDGLVDSNHLHSSYGFRTADLIGDVWSPEGQRQPRQLCIRDFNPHRVKRYMAGYRTNQHERLVEGGPPNSEIQNHFLEPIGGLPYLEITTQEMFLARGHILMDESMVVLSRVNEDDFIEGIEVLFFS